ncbi:MAG: hypothetical protein E7422_09135 [Ruminococcaceae bacterium]|nr:hypothetical protein [Oscillospiraceae bacterium]
MKIVDHQRPHAEKDSQTEVRYHPRPFELQGIALPPAIFHLADEPDQKHERRNGKDDIQPNKEKSLLIQVFILQVIMCGSLYHTCGKSQCTHAKKLEPLAPKQAPPRP